jgi:signal transduction histidine kinase
VRFPLAGSLFERAVETRQPISVAQYEPTAPALETLSAATGVGPVLTTPLVAQDRVIGALFVIRQRGAEPFGPRDHERLGVVADHAALALWKARLIEEAQTADRAKGNFLATISHELRTPLTALTGYGELLADEIVGELSRQQLDIVERMRSVTHHLTVMIDEILTYSALEVGREIVRAGPAAASSIVRDAVAVIEPLARQKGLAVEVELPASDPPLVTDVDKVRQILVNLGGNAVKFTDRGEVRFVVTAGADGGARFVVRDTGAGIAAEDQARIFQPFAQVETGLTRRHGGTGLGLYISRRLAELLGGRIELVSAPGRGSTFTLVLPRGGEDAPAAGTGEGGG